MIKCFTDGACSKNGSQEAIAGWAYVIIDDNNKIIHENSGFINNGTNNIGELTAIYNALKWLNSHYSNEFFTIYSDSAYCINGINSWRYSWKNNNWTRSTGELKNKDIWKAIDSLINDFLMTFEKVKGHTGNHDWNDYVDKMAVRAVRESKND